MIQRCCSNMRTLSVFIVLGCGVLAGCSSDDDDDGTPGGEPSSIELDFADDEAGWQGGFADYTAGRESFFELSSGIETLPEPLDGRRGFRLSGTNRSDDLFMFIKKRFEGFEPMTQYLLEVEVTFATNAPSGCVGVGGPPGEAVTIKAGASAMEPVPVDDGSGFLLINIDKGNQSTGGSDAVVLGDFANSMDCEQGNFIYETKTLDTQGEPFQVSTDAEGVLWMLFGTDSGFEANTTIYFLDGRVDVVR